MTKQTKEKPVNKFIVSFLRTDTTMAEIRDCIANTDINNHWAIMVNLFHLYDVKPLLEETGIRLATVVAYPLGCMTIETKIRQLNYAVKMQADEVFIQLNYNAVKSKDWAYVNEEIGRLKEVTKESALIIPIVETSIIGTAEKLELYRIICSHQITAVQLGSEMVGPALIEDIYMIIHQHGKKFERVDMYDGESTDETSNLYWGKREKHLQFWSQSIATEI